MVPDYVIDVLMGILFLNMALFVLLYNLSFTSKMKEKRRLSVGMIGIAAVITFSFVFYQVKHIEPKKPPTRIIKAVKVVEKKEYGYINIVLKTIENVLQLSILL